MKKRITSLITSIVLLFTMSNFKLIKKDNEYNNSYVIQFNYAEADSNYYLYNDLLLKDISKMNYMDKLNHSLVPIYGLETGILDYFGDIIDTNIDKNTQEYKDYIKGISMLSNVKTEDDFFKIYELIKPGYNNILEIICNYLNTLEPVKEFNPTNSLELYSMSQRLIYETTLVFLSHILDNDGYIYKNYVSDLLLFQSTVKSIKESDLDDFDSLYKKIKPIYDKVYKELINIQNKYKLKPNYNINGNPIKFNEIPIIEEIPDEEYLFKDYFDPMSKLSNFDNNDIIYAMGFAGYRLIDENKISNIIQVTGYNMDSDIAKPYWDYVRNILKNPYSSNYEAIYKGYMDLVDNLIIYFNYYHLNNPELNPNNYDQMIAYNTAMNIEVLFLVDLYETLFNDKNMSEDIWNNIHTLTIGTIPYYDKELNFDKDLTINKELYSNLYYGLIDYYNYFNETYLNNIVKTKTKE